MTFFHWASVRASFSSANNPTTLRAARAAPLYQQPLRAAGRSGLRGDLRFREDGHVVGEFWRFRSVAPVGEVLRGGLRLFQCRSHKRTGR